MNTQNYLFDSEFASQTELTTIPAGYVNKTVCGCGLTSLAIENNENLVIAMPRVYLVENKASQYPNKRCMHNLLAVYSGVTEEDILEYTNTQEKLNKPIKIMVTYDGLWKCVNILDKCKLVIDESDRMIADMGLKTQGKNAEEIDIINYMLDVAYKYKDTVSFISATPTNLKYLPNWISEINQVNMYWKNTIKVKPIIMERNNPFSALQNEIIKPIEKNGSVSLGDRTIKKCIIFINSVEQITKIIRECRLNTNHVAVICSDNTRNDVKIRGYQRLENPNKLPRYTFVTSSGFQGIDLVDKEAISVVVSSTTENHRMINALIDLKQAISRQRDKTNPNYNRYIFIYNQTIFKLSQEELQHEIVTLESELTLNVALLNELSGDKYIATKNRFVESLVFSRYAFLKNDWKVNEMLFKSEMEFIMGTRNQFTKGFNIISTINDDDKPIIVEKPIVCRDLSYSVLLAKYKNKESFNSEEKATDNYKLIDDYYKEFNSYTVNPTYAREALFAKGDILKSIKVNIQSTFRRSKDYDLKEVKETLQKIYDNAGIKRKAKATDLHEFFKEVKFKKGTKGIRKVEIIKK